MFRYIPKNPTEEKEIHSIIIPEAVRTLKGYGEGNPDDAEEYNAIIWRDGKCIYSHKGDIVAGVWVPLETEDITDISDLLSADNMFPVEGGGMVTFQSEYAYAVPSEITYAVKEETV